LVSGFFFRFFAPVRTMGPLLPPALAAQPVTPPSLAPDPSQKVAPDFAGGVCYEMSLAPCRSARAPTSCRSPLPQVGFGRWILGPGPRGRLECESRPTFRPALLVYFARSFLVTVAPRVNYPQTPKWVLGVLLILPRGWCRAGPVFAFAGTFRLTELDCPNSRSLLHRSTVRPLPFPPLPFSAALLLLLFVALPHAVQTILVAPHLPFDRNAPALYNPGFNLSPRILSLNSSERAPPPPCLAAPNIWPGVVAHRNRAWRGGGYGTVGVSFFFFAVRPACPPPIRPPPPA